MKKYIEQVIQKLELAKQILKPPREREREVFLIKNELHQLLKNNCPEIPTLYGKKVYSQNDEDGIIEHIFEKIGVEVGVFVEFGSGDGLENNTHYLLLKGWRGAWIDGDEKNAAQIQKNIKQSSNAPNLAFCGEFVTLENVVNILANGITALGMQPEDDVDLISMDLDGNDYYFVERLLSHCKAKVFCVEYNGKFPLNVDCKISYDPNNIWKKDDYMGASLASYIKLFGNFGYKLVACNLTGLNAFFVRSDYSSKFPSYPESQIYQPPRYYMTPYFSGFNPTLKYLADRISYVTFSSL